MYNSPTKTDAKILYFFKGLWFWSGLGELCACKVISQLFLSVLFYSKPDDYAAISGTQGLIFSSQNGSSSWGKQSLNIFKITSSYYLSNLYWQMANNPVWLVISYVWWSSMYCNFHDIRVTWIADVSLLLKQSRSYDLCTDLTVFSCILCWYFLCCLFRICSALFLLIYLIPTHLLFIHKHTCIYTQRKHKVERGVDFYKDWRDAVNTGSQYNVIRDTLPPSCL